MGSQTAEVRRGPKPRPHTRDNLIRAGVRMLHESGFTATGIKDIVAAAEVPKGSFYNYFESKEAFGAEVVDSYFETGLADLAARLGDESVKPLDRLKRYFSDRADGFKEAGFVRGCMLGNLSLEVADQIAPIRERLAEHFGTWSGLIERCIAQAQEAETISSRLPAALLAQFLLNSWEGALLRMRAEKSDAPLNQFIEVVFGSILV